MAARNRKGQFVKEGRRKSTTTITTTKRSNAPARRASSAVAAPRKRRHKSGMFGGGLVGRLVPDEEQAVSAVAGGAIGWLERGLVAQAAVADDAPELEFNTKVARYVPQLWTEGGFVGNVAIVLQLANAFKPHKWLRTARNAATAIVAEKWMKRGKGAPAGDDTSGEDEDADDDSGWVDPDAFEEQEQAAA